jgi:DNA repair protein RadD
MLRDYQQRALDMLFEYFEQHTGNPCLVLPTGAGKSHIIAEFCKLVVSTYSDQRILMLTHVKELIEQNAAKMRQHWPDAPLGIYSAGLRQRNAGEAITFAGIQSVAKKADLLGWVDIVLIDECFPSGTKIQTTTGLKNIELVRCGDHVYNANGIGKVVRVSAKPSYELYKLEFSDGTSVECTKNHPFFTEKGWQQAASLEIGSHVFGIEGVRLLWEAVFSLDKAGHENTKNNFGLSGAYLEQAKNLLGVLCEEIQKPDEQSSVSIKNEGKTSRNKAQAYSSWRQRAIAAISSISNAACFGRGMGSGASNQNQCKAQQYKRFTNLLQSGFGKPIYKVSHRNRRLKSFKPRAEKTRFEENKFFDFPRLERISIVKRKSPVPVFNLQVEGHPSFFANGKLVHNCHRINHAAEGNYRRLIDQLTAINPQLKVIGLTATPYRLGHGYITDAPAIFTDLLEPIEVLDLVRQGYLAPLRSLATATRFDLSEVKKRGGEYVEADLEAAVNRADLNQSVAAEIFDKAEQRESILVFCVSVAHAFAMRDALQALGVTTETIVGITPPDKRAQIIADFKAGKIRALTNANVLTTGFDAPNVDCIAACRPTLSTSLYVQMLGRGTRLKEHINDCLVLDFAGLTHTHGVFDQPIVKKPKKTEGGEAPVKACPKCHTLCHTAVRQCPHCGYMFPPPKPPQMELKVAPIMSDELVSLAMVVKDWRWDIHNNGTDMLRVRYYPHDMLRDVVTEYFTVWHGGAASYRAWESLKKIMGPLGLPCSQDDDIYAYLHNAPPPTSITYRKEGRFFRVISRSWEPIRSL